MEQKGKRRNGGYYPKSRGIMDYIGQYTDAAWKLYDWLLANAKWNVPHDDPGYATHEFMISDAAHMLNHHPQTVKRSMRELVFGYPDDDPPVPPFIEIVAVSGKTRSQTITVRICKAKLRPGDFKISRPKKSPRVKTPHANPETAAYLKSLADGVRRKRRLPNGAK